MPKSTKNPNKIYLDYAAATPIEPAVSKAMQRVYKENFASPSSIHEFGVSSRRILEKSINNISKIFGAHKDEIIFTSGSTESNNLAIFGLINSSSTPHIVTTNIEHPSVLEVFKYLEDEKKIKVTYVPVESNGLVDPKKIKKALNKNTILVSVMYANSEIGTIEPLKEIAKEIRHFNKKNPRKVYFHSDATQALNYLSTNVEKLGVDLLSFSGVKIYGPKGIGGLYVKRGTPLNKIIFGGDQQFGLRAGSYNLPSIVGLTEALEITEKIKLKEIKRLTVLRDYFIQKLRYSTILTNYRIVINGDLKNRLPNNVNISVPKIPSDLLVLELSAHGIMASAKSACKAGDGKASHVIQALRAGSELDGAVRFSLGRHTTKQDIDFTLKSLFSILTKLKKWYN